ncbi:ABC transporter ATP-binding protein [Actinoplanes sp. NPDC048796]|uniref:ABC transporter ATP-binding protein n=1 Tax=Actinoplanes sp. NPDC048796 TaxID=3155640 RepID=UPI0033E42FB2
MLVAPVLELRSVTRTHGSGETMVRALDDVSVSVSPGELVAIMGASGSGKSTLLAIAGGLDRPTSGDVLVEGASLASMSRKALAKLRRDSVGYVFQALNLLSSLNAIENVMLPLELDGVGVRAARREAVGALSAVGLSGLESRFPHEMSGGQQQRVAIARALVGRRRLVLADEPTGALDTATGDAVLRLLRERVNAGAAGVLVTHDPGHARWADRVVHLRDGRVVSGATAVTVPMLVIPAGRAR